MLNLRDSKFRVGTVGTDQSDQAAYNFFIRLVHHPGWSTAVKYLRTCPNGSAARCCCTLIAHCKLLSSKLIGYRSRITCPSDDAPPTGHCFHASLISRPYFRIIHISTHFTALFSSPSSCTTPSCGASCPALSTILSLLAFFIGPQYLSLCCS